jgi:hypothetical protein
MFQSPCRPAADKETSLVLPPGVDFRTSADHCRVDTNHDADATIPALPETMTIKLQLITKCSRKPGAVFDTARIFITHSEFSTEVFVQQLRRSEQ